MKIHLPFGPFHEPTSSQLRRRALCSGAHLSDGRGRLRERRLVAALFDLSGDLSEIGIQEQKIQIPSDSNLVDATLAELETRGRSTVVARPADGASVHKPPLDTRLAADDALIVMGRQDIIPDFTERLYPKRQIQYRGATS